MKQQPSYFSNTSRRAYAALILLVLVSLSLFSFRAQRLTGDFLDQLGITRISADAKITGSLLGGYLDQYGIRNAKNIATGNRVAVTADLLAYTKQYVSTEPFKKEYSQLRDNNKPKTLIIQSPDELRDGMIEQSKKSIAETEANFKKADASMKNIFEPILTTLRQQLKDTQDPNNALLAGYRKNYAQMLKTNEEGYQQRLTEWKTKYPENQLLFIKTRLRQFLDETDHIDFTAQLIEKNGKKYFANPAYEHKGNRWKLAFRAGAEVVGTARSFAKQWAAEIN